MKTTARQLVVSLGLTILVAAGAAAAPIPELVQKDGRHALMVDGAPFVMFGGQAQNSSNYPLALDKVWAAIKDANANTLEIPVAWEQIEAVEGKFDFSYVDTLVAQARKNKVRLVLLWFGTWKNTGANYTPEWVKFDNARFPRMVDQQGKPIYCLSPQGEETLKADKKAFVALMAHIKKIDDVQRTVIMMQVQNEVGTYGYARDYGPKAEALFNGPVPAEVLKRKKSPVALAATGSWKQVYGDYADEYFHAYSVAKYIGEIAKAGRDVYNLPMFVNNSIRDSLEEPVKPWNKNFASGGPTFDVIDIYKAAAPAIDFAAPDIYNPEWRKFVATLDKFQRADNALAVPEMSNAAEYVRYAYLVIGRGAINFSPFGIDYADYSNFPLGHKATDKTMTAAYGKIFGAFRAMERQWSKWAFEGRTYGVAEGDDRQPQKLALKGWNATISFREWQFGEAQYFKDVKDLPANTEKPNGGVAIAQIADNEFIIVGQHARVKIDNAEGKPTMWARVEEGRYDASGKWIMERNWNGDQTDYGLNLTGNPVVLKVKVGTY